MGTGCGTEGLIAEVRRRGLPVELIAGGGIRGVADLHRLRAIGADAVLVASALHDGRLAPDDLRQL
jgi:phosphoribosylformimino-5-aminoimidazole carboxamide ribotide isomerase